MNYSDITQEDVDGLLALSDKLDDIINTVGETAHPYDNRLYELCNLSNDIRNVASALTFWFLAPK